MVDKSNNSTNDAVPSEGVLTHLSALERRRFLFKSLGKGVGVGVALGGPLSAYANNEHGERKLGYHHKSQTSSELYHCAVSGMQSAIASRDLANTTLAAGHSPGWWGNLVGDGKTCKNYNVSGSGAAIWGPPMERTFPLSLSNWSWTTPMKTVLTFSTLSTDPTLGMLMAKGDGECNKSDGNELNYGKYNGHDAGEEVHWMCAILNAAVLYPAKFPYSAETIRNVANRTDTSIDRAGLYTLVCSLEDTGGL